MLKDISTYLQFGNRFCGIEHTSKNGQDRLYVTLLKKSKKEVDIEATLEVSTIKILAEQIPKNQHAVLIINNESVLTKTVESDITDDLKLIYKAFPNIKLEDFYYQVAKQDSICFVSICRKTDVETLINNYKNEDISIIDISLGSIAVFSIYEFIKTKTIITSNTQFIIADNNISAIEKVTKAEQIDYDINGIKVSNTQLLSFAGALNLVVNNYLPHTNFEAYKNQLLSIYKQSRFFSLFLKFGLAFLLVVLLINFSLFSHYYSAVNELQQTSQINQTTKSKVLHLNESVNKTKKTVDDMLKSTASKSSFYVNEIIQSLPLTILLSELNYQPLLKRIKAEKPIENEIHVILISGTSNSSESYSNWIADLESLKWINNVEILSYGDVSKSTSEFSIKLNITND